jgi:hypothetical protein
MKKKLLFIITILLVAANGIVFFNIQKKRNKLERAHQLLVNDTTIAKHLRYVWRIQKSALRSYPPREDQTAYTACLAAVALMEAVDDLEKFSRQGNDSNPGDFFSESIAVDAALRDSLYTSYEKFYAAMRTWYADTLSEAFYQTSKKARANYHAMVTKANATAMGRVQQFVFSLEMPGDSPAHLSVTATKVNDSIVWNDVGNRIPAFLRNLDFFTYQSRLSVRESLDGLQQTLGVRNKVKVFNDVYDLTDLSPAQLRVVVNHLKFMQTEMSSRIVQPVNFYRDEE